MNTDVRLKIKTLDNKVNVIECPTCISIAELKKRIEVVHSFFWLIANWGPSW